MRLGLEKKVVFVAGASRGIGLAVASAFLREGAAVVISGRDAGALDSAAEALRETGSPERVLALRGDMTLTGDIGRTVAETVDRFGGLDALVANVGSGAIAPGWDVSRQDWQAALEINLLGGVELARVALPHLIQKRAGSITFVSSIAGLEAMGAPLAYGAAKAALQSAMKSLARMAGPHGVRINSVAPGNVLFPGGRWEQKLAERPEFFHQYIQSEVPLQRFGRPEEIADAVIFLASERASFITGACLVVDGGQNRSFFRE